MDRRRFLTESATVVIGMAACPTATLARSDPLTELLNEVGADAQMVEDSWAFRAHTQDPPDRGVPRGNPSQRKLSQAAIDMIIAFEVASPRTYTERYRRPIWPKGRSGVTIGVGYDLRFADQRNIDRDWPMLSPKDRNLLYSVIGLSGDNARDALPSVQSVDISWDSAKRQFLEFIPYPTKEAEGTFQHCGDLGDDSFGALVSLIYNRGSQISRNIPNRLEMYEIQQLMASKKFASIPDRIRAMKRLWANDPNARGLVKRREAEALLFERGLAAPVVADRKLTRL